MIKFICLFLFFLCFQSPLLAQTQQTEVIVKPQVFDTVNIKGILIFGKSIDQQTRCVHYHSALDIIALKFKCCGNYYPCYTCHQETTDHKPEVWPISEYDQKAIVCGVCGNELSIKDYMACNNTCPKCSSLFNPGCKNHYHLYFEVNTKSRKDGKSESPKE